MSKKKEDALCIECKEKVTGKQYSVSCSICDRWLHKDCGLDDDEYKLIDKIFQKKGSHFWSCDGCSRGLSKLQQMVTSNKVEIDSLKLRVDSLETSDESQTADIAQAKKDIKLLTDDVGELKNSGGGSKETVYSELDLREHKKFNIIIYGVPEQDENEQPSVKKSKDSSLVSEIFTDISVKVDMKNDVKFLARVGEFKNNKTRPITIGFRETNTRDKVLSSAWKLGKSRTNRQISISPDLTKIQLANDKKLREEVEAKNDSLSTEEAKNFVWKLVGIKGQRQMRKERIRETTTRPDYRTRTNSMRRTREEMEEDDDLLETREDRPRGKKRC